MANKRYDICTPRKSKEGKTFWTRIGTAWEGDKGTQLVFDALPIPDSEGRVVANLFEPRESSANTRSGGTARPQPASQYDDVNEEAPF